MKKLNEYQKLSITFLRIFSCIAVFAIHFVNKYSNSFPDIVNQAASFGQDGLWMFFILSGFLLCYSKKSILTNNPIKDGLKKYYINRVLRILPLAFVWLIVIFVTNAVLLNEVPTFDWKWLISVFFANSVVPTKDYYTWNSMFLYGSLSSFVIFYAIFPLLIKRINTMAKARFLFLISTFIYAINSTLIGLILNKTIGGEAYILHSMGFLSTFWFFSIGIYIYYSFETNDLIEPFLVFAVLFLASLRLSFLEPVFKGAQGGTLMAVLLILFILLFDKAKDDSFSFYRTRNFFNTIEKYTFPLFMCHMLIFAVIDKLSLDTYVAMSLCIAFPCLVAVVLYHAVCVPSKLVERFLIRKIDENTKED